MVCVGPTRIAKCRTTRRMDVGGATYFPDGFHFICNLLCYFFSDFRTHSFKGILSDTLIIEKEKLKSKKMSEKEEGKHVRHRGMESGWIYEKGKTEE